MEFTDEAVRQSTIQPTIQPTIQYHAKHDETITKIRNMSAIFIKQKKTFKMEKKICKYF